MASQVFFQERAGFAAEIVKLGIASIRVGSSIKGKGAIVFLELQKFFRAELPVLGVTLVAFLGLLGRVLGIWGFIRPGGLPNWWCVWLQAS